MALSYSPLGRGVTMATGGPSVGNHERVPAPNPTEELGEPSLED